MNKIKFQIRFNRIQILDEGFSLIELLVVAAIITTLLSIGVSALVTYSNAQVFNSKVSEMVTTLETAKTYAQSQVKKCVVDTDTFDGYSVAIDSLTTYTLNSLCKNGATDRAPNPIETKTVRTPVTVTGTTVIFKVLTGSASGGPVTITGYGRCQTISVYTTGNITIGGVRFICP